MFLRPQRGDVINSGGLINEEEEIDLNTIKLINNECFNFIQCLLSKWNQSASRETKPFGGHLCTRDDGAIMSLVVSMPHVRVHHFQQKWSNLLNQICKLVEKNIKSKKKSIVIAAPTTIH